MALTCENCGAENLAINRYCGQCGSKLIEPSKDDMPEEFWRESGKPQVSAQADVSDAALKLHTRTILHSSDDDSLFQPTAHRQDAGENTQTSAGPAVAVSTSPQAGVDQYPHADGKVSAEQHSTTHTGVSGPSFLGLTDDDGLPDYDDMDEPRPHVRRNLALVILAIAAVLFTLQWQSIRNYGLAYIQSGSQKVQQSSEPAQASPAELAASSTTSNPISTPPASAAPSAPQSVQNSPNADHNLPVRQSGHSRLDTAKTQQPSAMSAPSADAQESALRTTPSNSFESNSATRTGPSLQATRADEPLHGAYGPGADEMRHAAKASDPGDRAAWLWRAVGKGNPEAPVQLATMYELGDGVVRSCDQAQLLLRAAVSRGNEQAKVNLRQILRGGCPAR